MKIQEKILEDWKTAMREKNDVAKTTLSILRSSIQSAEKEKRTELDEQAVLAIINKEISKREDASIIYEKAGEIERANKERQEQTLLSSYLPVQLTDEELNNIIDKSISSIGASSIKDMGKVMGYVVATVKGGADNKRISSLIKEKLNG